MRTYTGETGERFWEMTVTVKDTERPEQMTATLFYDTRDSLLGEQEDSSWDTWFGMNPDQRRGRPLFEWGHTGTPARRLAAAILMDHLAGIADGTGDGTGDEQDRLDRVNPMYQDFAHERIAKLVDREHDPLRRWEMGSEEVARWVTAWEARPGAEQQAERAAGPPMEPCRKQGHEKGGYTFLVIPRRDDPEERVLYFGCTGCSEERSRELTPRCPESHRPYRYWTQDADQTPMAGCHACGAAARAVPSVTRERATA